MADVCDEQNFKYLNSVLYSQSRIFTHIRYAYGYSRTSVRKRWFSCLTKLLTKFRWFERYHSHWKPCGNECDNHHRSNLAVVLFSSFFFLHKRWALNSTCHFKFKWILMTMTLVSWIQMEVAIKGKSLVYAVHSSIDPHRPVVSQLFPSPKFHINKFKKIK